MYILTHTHKWRKKELLPLATWMDLETVMLSEDREKINTVWHYLYVEPKKKKAKIIETESCQGLEDGRNREMSVKGYILPITR